MVGWLHDLLLESDSAGVQVKRRILDPPLLCRRWTLMDVFRDLATARRASSIIGTGSRNSIVAASAARGFRRQFGTGKSLLFVGYPTKLMGGQSMRHASETCLSATAQTAVVQIAIFELPLVIRRSIRSNRGSDSAKAVQSWGLLTMT